MTPFANQYTEHVFSIKNQTYQITSSQRIIIIMTSIPTGLDEKTDVKGEAEHYEIEESSLHPDLTDLQKEILVVAALSEEDFKLEEKKLVRKIDTRLLPTLFILLVLNYLDRNALA